MLQIHRTLWAIFIVALHRLWTARWLALAAAAGLVAVVALALSVPLYADAVYHRVLLTTIEDAQVDQQGIRRPPFTFLYRYTGKFDGALDWQTIVPVDQYMVDQVPGSLGIPRQQLVRYFETRLGQLFVLTDTAYLGKRNPLIWTSIATIADSAEDGNLAEHLTVVEGRFPVQANVTGPDVASVPVEVMASKTMAEKLGLQVDETYLLFYRPPDSQEVQLLVRVSGIWAPRDVSDPFWFSSPGSLDEVLLTAPAVFSKDLAAHMGGEVFLAAWYMVFDGTGVRSEHVAGLLERIRQTMNTVTVLLRRTHLDVSPVEALESYQASSRLLTVQLLAISVPMILLLFAFTLLVTGLMVADRQNEVAVLRSRGASVMQVIGIALLESLVLGVLALLAGIPAAEGLASLVGRTRSFLNFSGDAAMAVPLQVTLTFTGIQIGFISVGAAVFMSMVPTWSAAQHTVVSYKQNRARSLRPPWWQRTWIDLLLLIPAAYGTYLLQKQGAIVLPSAIGQAATPSQDPFANPLLFLVPVLAILGLTLFLIRLLPYLLRLVAWALARIPGVALVMAARQLARSPGLYAAPMLLLVLTLGLATFTSSLAATLDQHLTNQIRYSVGGDMSLDEAGESTRDTGQNVIGGINLNPSTGNAGAKSTPGPLYMFLPVEDHLKIDGVLAAARIAGYRAQAHFSARNASARFLGIDRLDFARVSYWREDFASQSLGGLMNLLASRYDAVLVPESVLQDNALQIGDPVQIVVNLPDGPATLDLNIVGTFRLWPGWNPANPDKEPLLVANLEYLFDRAGGQVPYEVWLKVKPGSDPQSIIAGVGKLGVYVNRYAFGQNLIDQEQTRPMRQGLFGMLSIGFGAAGLFTVLGFFLYAVFSMRRRAIELGVLRAIGFNQRQMATFLGSELALLLGVGIGAGAILGVIASRLYIPYFQISASEEARALPFAVVIAWPEILRIYALFGLMFVVALIALLLVMRHLRIHEAIKLGESA